jgi:hypothetical protein
MTNRLGGIVIALHRDRLSAVYELPGNGRRGILTAGEQDMENSVTAWWLWAMVFVASWSWTLPVAEEVGKKPVTVMVILERFPSNPWTLPNGKTIRGGGALAEGFTCDPGEVEKAVATAKRHHAEAKELIAQQRGYRLLKVYGEEKYGGKLYKYMFTYSDGRQGFKEFSIPLENVMSWDDFLQKRQAEEDERHEAINRAIVARRYRLKHTETRYSFICQGADATEKYRVSFMPGRKGKHRASITPLEPKVEAQEVTTLKAQEVTTLNTTSWQEHLQAVREGKRKVLTKETKKIYYYEMFLEDGSKTLFPYRERL